MAEEILYDQIETNGDPDPLGLRKKLSVAKVPKGDPLGLRTTAYSTSLTPREERNFQTWKSQLPENLRNEGDYDLKGLYKKNPNIKPSSNLHFEDTYKKPNHITFSEESIYNNPDKGIKGGKWAKENGQDVFYASDINIKNAGGVDKLQDYFKRNEPNVKLILPTKESKVFQLQLSQPTFKSAPAPTGVREFSFEKPKDELAPIKLEGKAREAHANLQKELQGNQDVKVKMIKQRRFEEAAREIPISRSDMPQIQSAIDVERLIPKGVKPQDIPVTDDDLIKEDQDILADRGKAVRLLEETMKTRPEKAKEIQKNIYTVDAFNSLSQSENAHERVPKIETNAKKIDKGELIYDARSGRLIKPLGLIGSSVEGWKQKSKLFADYDFLKNTENDAAIASELEDRRTKHDPDEPIPVPKGKVSEIAGMLGGTPVKPILGGALASLGGPEASMAAGAVIGGREFAKIEYASNFQQVYNELRDQGVEKFEAIREARKQAEDAAEIGAVTGAAMGVLGGRIGAKPFSALSLGTGFKQAAFNVLKSTGNELGKAGLEGLTAGGIGAAGQVYKNKLAQAAGINRPLDEGVAEHIEGNLLATVAMGAAIKAGRGMTKPNYKSLLHGLSKMPDEQINGMLKEKVNAGEITQEAADATTQRINEYRGLDKLIPDNVTEEARFKIQDKIQKRNELEQQIESTDKAYHTAIKEKIKAIDEEIIALSKETEKPPKAQSGLTRAQEKEAIETAEEFMAEGILPNTYEGMIKQDPIGFWKMIAQQAQNRDENWKPLGEQISEEAVKDQFGDTVVDYAKELFPAPELPASTERVSVIMPDEMKQPTEIITIKPKEDAISERSAAQAVMDETPGSGPEMGERIPESGEAAIPQEGQPAIEESAIEGKEKVGGVYAERPPTQISFRGLQEVANEFGYDDVKKRDRVSDVQERKNAEVTANEWASKGEYQKNIDDLLTRIENKEHVPTAKQRLILEQYLANERQRLRELPKTSAEYDAQLLKVKRIKDIGQIARQEAGAALRLPNEGTLPHPILDEADAMAAKMEANAVDKLTDQQKAEVEAQVEKYKKAAEESNAKISILEERVSRIDAEKEFKKVKSTTKRTKKTPEERAAYRREQIEAAREALKKLRTGESGLSAVPLPFVRELIAIAPHVKNIMVDLVEQGATELGEVVKKLHDEFKDVLEGITEKNIHDIIAGEYNEKRRPLTELQHSIKDMQTEAKLINQIEALESGVPPKSERSIRERNKKIKALKDKLAELNKEFKKDSPDYKKQLKSIKTRNENRIKELQEKINNKDFSGPEKKVSIFDREDVKASLSKERKEALDAISKKEDVQYEFDLALFNDEMDKKPWYQKGADFAAKLIHTSKAVMSGIDDSATFVQNGLLMLANPKMGAKVWLKHWKEAFNDAEFKRELAAIHARPDWEIIKNSGLEIVEPHTAASKAVEEAFEQNLLAGKIKFKDELGNVKKEYQPWKYTGGIFERAFTSMGNNFRLALFEKRMQMLKDDGKTFESHPQEYKSAARAINELTARGKLPQGLAQASPYITPFVWAPRMLTSTINVLGLSDIALGLWHKGYYQNLTPTQRKFALAQLGRGVGMGVAIMGAAALGGAKIDYDPRSVTFGDVIIGDHHFNVFGRFVPVIKTLVQASLGTRIKKGEVQDLDNSKFGAKTRMGVVGGFFRGKMTPAAGAAYDLLEGRNYYTQKEFGVKDLPKALLMPMSINDLIQGWQHDGTISILTRFLPAFEGMKVSDERDFNKNEKDSGSSGNIKKGVNKTRKTNTLKQLHK